MKKLIVVFFLLLVGVQNSLAQAPPPSGGSTVGAPIDDHIWFLSIITILYGTYSIYKNRKQLILKKA